MKSTYKVIGTPFSSLLLLLALVFLVLPTSLELLNSCDYQCGTAEATTAKRVMFTRSVNSHRQQRKLDELGGYSPVDDLQGNDGVTEAASFAFGEYEDSPSTYSILQDPPISGDVAGYEVTGASQQVVAGMNYKLDLVFQDSSGACVGAATVVVYDEFGARSISSWVACESKCKELAAESDINTSTAFTSPQGSILHLIQILPMTMMLLQ